MTDIRHEDVVGLLDCACDAPPAAVAAIQRYGLASLLTGTAATLAGISTSSGLSIDEIHAAVTGLEAAGRIEIEDSRVVGVRGLTINQTSHTLDLGAVTMHTWCALDAVGIPAALALDAKVSTVCPHCGDQIHVAMTAGVPADDDAIRLLCPTAPCSDVRAEFCTAANLFCTSDHLNRWVDSHPIEGSELDLDATTELGRAMWAGHRRSPSESQDQ